MTYTRDGLTLHDDQGRSTPPFAPADGIEDTLDTLITAWNNGEKAVASPDDFTWTKET